MRATSIEFVALARWAGAAEPAHRLELRVPSIEFVALARWAGAGGLAHRPEHESDPDRVRRAGAARWRCAPGAAEPAHWLEQESDPIEIVALARRAGAALAGF